MPDRAALALASCAAGFAAFGLLFLLRPSTGLLIGIDPTTPAAATDLRAVFGGMELGLAAFVAHCARRPDTLRTGALVAALVFAGMVLGRALGLLLDGPAPATFLLGGAELAGLAVALLALRWGRP